MLVQIRDTGQGMRADELALAFGTTFTTRNRDAAGSPPQHGMGLGLPLVRELMHRMGGRVSLESTVSVGTCVVLVLPAHQLAQGHLSSGARARVLLVDDDAQLRRVTSRLLEQSGVGVLPVADGEEALRILSSGMPFSAVLLDLNMPVVNGRDVLKFVQTMKQPPPVVVFTSEETAELREELLALGAVAVVAKPFRGQDLVDTLRASFRAG